MKKSVSTELTSSNIATIQDLLADTPRKLEALSYSFSPNQLLEPIVPGERSFTQDLAHILDSEARSSEAIYLASLADQPLLVEIHPERQWGRLLRYDQMPFSELLTYFRFHRTVLLRILASLTNDQWARSVREQGKKCQESVYWEARSLAMHEIEHLFDLGSKLPRLY